MSQVEPHEGYAVVENHQEDIFYGSSLAIQGVFVKVIQARFSGSNKVNIPYYWDPDPTPAEDEEQTFGKPRKLMIESGYLEHPEARNYRPSIWVDSGDCVPLKDGVANRMHRRLEDGLEIYYLRTRHRVDVLVVAETRGECSVLADHVWFHLLACRMLVRSLFGLHEFTEPSKGAVRPVRRDKDCWETTISFDVEVAMRWATAPIAPLLNEVHATLEVHGDGDALLGAARYVLFDTRSSSR